jgi:alpha-ketoglutarate-dependent taurine dioxygenase
MATLLKNRPQVDTAAADALSKDVVLTSYEPGRGLPLFVQPNTPRLYDDTDYALDWLDDHRQAIERMLSSAGAIVLRGFPIDRSVHFARITKAYGPFEDGYTGGADSRTTVVDHVMTAGALRADLSIEPHQEMCYLPRYPTRLAFYCRMAPVTGGATMLCDMREVSARIDPVLFNTVAQKHIRYVRNFRAPGSEASHPVIGKYHKTWTENFNTKDPAVAEAGCRALGFAPRWRDDGALEATYTIPGVIAHPHTGEQLWFNQLATFVHTPRTNAGLHQAFNEAYKDGEPWPLTTTYGDGTPIPVEQVEPIVALQREIAVAYPWSHGDIMLIDNYLVGHGRTPYTGRRDIQVALLGA